MKKLALFFLFLFIFSVVFSQNSVNSTIPLEIGKAYHSGTRSLNGLPGPNYWQNSSDYQISVELDSENSMIHGTEKITYFNNSPDTLRKIVLRLYQDIYRKGNQRDWPVNEKDLHEGTKISFLKINQELVDLNNSDITARTATNLVVNLALPLLSKDTLLVECGWSFPIPKTRQIRMGNYGQNNFFIAYWYPQIAVYDDIDGWDMNEYTGTVEFYNDINNFDVSIKTNGNSLVWATGELQNQKSLFTENILARLEKAKQSDEVIRIVNSHESMQNQVLVNNTENTWHFIAKQVPDFSFASASQSNWEGSSMVVDKLSGRQVFIEAVFPDSVLTFDKVANYARTSVKYMSEQLPGWPFPYPKITVFCNANKRGGMESPMMCNNGDASESWDEDNLTFHEIVHNYFPFFMGTNERKYAWMDEGWAAFLVSGYNDIYSPGYDYLGKYVKVTEQFIGKEAEVPPMYLSYQIKNYKAYRTHAYGRPAMAYNFLQNALGDSLFKVALNTYIQYWHGKHPIPYDFFNCIEFATDQDLDWFFLPWFFDRSYADLGIKKITNDNQVVIENIGGLPLPIILQCEFEDGTIEEYNRDVSVWRTGNQAVVIDVKPGKRIKNVHLGNVRIPDVNGHNNDFSL